MLEGRRLAAVGWFQRGEKALALSIPARVTTTLPSMHEASAGKFGLLSNQGISGSISLEA